MFPQALERFYEAVMQGILRHINFDGKRLRLLLCLAFGFLVSLIVEIGEVVDLMSVCQ